MRAARRPNPEPARPVRIRSSKEPSGQSANRISRLATTAERKAWVAVRCRRHIHFPLVQIVHWARKSAFEPLCTFVWRERGAFGFDDAREKLLSAVQIR